MTVPDLYSKLEDIAEASGLKSLSELERDFLCLRRLAFYSASAGFIEYFETSGRIFVEATLEALERNKMTWLAGVYRKAISSFSDPTLVENDNTRLSLMLKENMTKERLALLKEVSDDLVEANEPLFEYTEELAERLESEEHD